MRLVIGLVALALSSCASRAQRSIALYEAGDYAGAAHAADQGLASHPRDESLWQMRIRAAVALGDREGVATAYAAYREKLGEDDRELLHDLAVATLGQALASPSAKLKVAAIEIVESAEIESLAEDVTQCMGDDNDRVAAAAAIAVLRSHPQAGQIADSMLHSEDPEARRIVIDGIARKYKKLALADVRAAAADPDLSVRRTAIRWLGTLKDSESVELLMRQLKHADENVRATAASALARIGIGNLPSMAKQALGDKALAVRLAGVELLAAARRTDELVAIAGRDADPTVAAEAALAAKRPDLAAPAIERAAAAQDWAVRAGAANIAVRGLGAAKAGELARRLVGDADLRVRLAAARVLAHTNQRDAAAQVFAAALEMPETAIDAAADLAALGDPRGTRALDAAVRDAARSGDQRAAAVTAHRTAHVVTPGLVAAIADPNGVVRVEAAAVLIALSKE